jgi:opacity protein-like surface antigen
MKRSIATASGVAVLLVSAVGAQAVANIDSGKYKGKTNKGNQITFKVTKGKKLTHFTHKGLKMKCSDGDSFRLKKLDSGKDKLSILDNGRFEFKVTYDNGGKWKATGRIKGRKAKGTLKMTVRFNSDNQADPNGNIFCTSGKLKFTAKHKRH